MRPFLWTVAWLVALFAGSLTMAFVLTGGKRDVQIAYRIPTEHKDAAAQLIESLVTHAPAGYDPAYVYNEAMRVARETYWEPVVVKP